MNLQKLFKMQRELDSYIETNMKVNEDVFQRKGLALIVELAELANETRCFKFWSNKGASEREVILEEYVDSIHFLLSLGIEKKLDYLEVWPQSNLKQEITEIFLMTNSAILDFLTNPSENRYEKVWIMYGAIAEKLGFSSEEVLNAYISKNETNYERQKNGY
ncbi:MULTISPECIES: dUTP diphosphatase [Psychrobacillus]|uniref:dUTP diphosphatase n=1 Tax=Psychrobacillus faecigallinarum TaxID=2762235 RepID=A0ABR8R723_9BACI|nr:MULTISPECIES: dUTP diphosphatase [Psychrobacillus]MBD7943599.1 dUTP diphosphatase [Psychrobacillus faecigallinarum]QEY22748.1 dUTPase [Psychrobacillus sp. AK 1817]QGM29618.1 dUTPase [Bacillus sp. N3536]